MKIEGETQSQPEKVNIVMVVRDKDGNPKFDDPHNVPAEVFKSLTEKDLEYLNKLRSK